MIGWVLWMGLVPQCEPRCPQVAVNVYELSLGTKWLIGMCHFMVS